MHLIERILWISGAIMVLGILVWAFAPGIQNTGGSDDEGGSWFSKSHTMLRSVGDTIH